VDYTLYAKAVVFAMRQHQGQVRRESEGESDYVIHPIRVAEHLRRLAACEDVEILCAAVLHDTVEDSGTRYDELAEAFGDRVARLVAELTNDNRLPKEQRHQEMLRRMATLSPDAKLIKLSDRYDNLRSVAETDPEKRRRILQETPRMLESLRGTSAVLESAIELRLKELRTED
jgi:guanosine-3',5'-bis(diphosphate) 3'-pyrophosphohydrolase